MSLDRDRVRSARAEEAAAFRRLADAATIAAFTLDDHDSLPDELDRAVRRAADRYAAVKEAHEVHNASRAGLARIAVA